MFLFTSFPVVFAGLASPHRVHGINLLEENYTGRFRHGNTTFLSVKELFKSFKISNCIRPPLRPRSALCICCFPGVCGVFNSSGKLQNNCLLWEFHLTVGQRWDEKSGRNQFYYIVSKFQFRGPIRWLSNGGFLIPINRDQEIIGFTCLLPV